MARVGSLDSLADDQDFRFLCVDRKKLLAEQTKPFDGKKNCWVPDDKLGYVKAEIQGAKGEDVTVVTEHMEVCEMGQLEEPLAG